MKRSETATPEEPEKFVIYSALNSAGNEKTWKSRSVSLSTDVLDRNTRKRRLLMRCSTPHSGNTATDSAADRAVAAE